MTDASPTIRLDADERVRLAARAFMLDGAPRLSVLVKATVDLSTGAVVEPREILARDIPHNPKNPLSSPVAVHDLALGKARCDVTLVGSARASGPPAPRLDVRLALTRGADWLLDKRAFARAAKGEALIVEAPVRWESTRGGGGTTNPVGSRTPRVFDPSDPSAPACFAPIPEQWPARYGLLTADQRAALKAPVPSITSSFPFEYFQCAPPDQRVHLLRGDEWLLLEGFSQATPALRARLPGLGVRVWIASRGGATVDVPIAIDTLAIDADRLLASVTFRAHIASPAAFHALDDHVVVARLVVGGAVEPARMAMRPDAFDTRWRQPLGVTLGGAGGGASDHTMDARDAPKLEWSAPFAIPSAPLSAPSSPIPGAPWSRGTSAAGAPGGFADASPHPAPSSPAAPPAPVASAPMASVQGASSPSSHDHFRDREPTPPTGSDLYRRALQTDGRDEATIERWVRAWRRQHDA